MKNTKTNLEIISLSKNKIERLKKLGVIATHKRVLKPVNLGALGLS